MVAQYLGDLGCEHVVFKNDEKTIEELRALNPRGILLSPGPGQSNYMPHLPSLPLASFKDLSAHPQHTLTIDMKHQLYAQLTLQALCRQT